ncbi:MULTISPECIES: AIPR family protein [unclassified Ruegeria]|uniref:AIPR family protein n=1 Tax=unclassified Ruegeria TaxID=2625375 RepID=UPI0014912222|nr:MULTISPECIES: AIPR family protein [unclassified Ruegeria]NOD49828.1 hypothetical protein [Ruegeria sp. HKCCD5849]NOD54188.1 hypothetical protein [Ruegeria sp. HKCCD5851]NOD70159.1 hypothetical protein [Ruegeria sp. HKCCD7303]
MIAADLEFGNLTQTFLKPYQKRGATESTQFLRWVLENIYRLEPQDADDACVDKKQDKGVDGILVNDTLETVHVFQSKVRMKAGSKLGDTDLKEFCGTLKQFETPENIQVLLDGEANAELKGALVRERIKEKVAAGYSVEGVFCCNASLNQDGLDFLKSAGDLVVYDADRIASEFVDLEAKSGINEDFVFDTSDTEVIKYQTADGVTARIFLANALQLTHMKGISDQTLFSQNVRLALGNTKVNKSLVASIKNKGEHKNFPLYHNGITVLCSKIDEAEDQLKISSFVVVNGAQSLTSLLNSKASITADLKVLTKVVALGDDAELSDKITHNSNNQNAIKPRDQKSNHSIQQRLKKEIKDLAYDNIVLEVKQGEINAGKRVLKNEDAGLSLLAIDLGEPWACHQKFKVMDDAHAKIFGRADVNGAKLVFCNELLESVGKTLDGFDDQVFGHYNLTRYFVAHSVAQIFKDEPTAKDLLQHPKTLFDKGLVADFVNLFSEIASTTVDDLNAEVGDLLENGEFDHKRDLKSPTWCRAMSIKLTSAYKKDVKRKRVKPIAELISELMESNETTQ